MAVENYYDKETKTYRFDGKQYAKAADYSKAVKTYNADMKAKKAAKNSTPNTSPGFDKLSDVEKKLVNDHGWTNNGDGTLSARTTGKRYDHEAGGTFDERYNLGADYTPPGAETASSTNSGVPDWVDPDYGYDVNNPRKPNMRELMESISGRTVEELYADPDSNWQEISKQASNMLYGVVGSNQDTRNWNAIMSAGKDPDTGNYNADRIKAAAGIATSQMYGGTDVKVIKGANGETNLGIVGGNGTLLRTLSGSVNTMKDSMQVFGVRNTDWVGGAVQTLTDNLSTINNNIQQLNQIISDPNSTDAQRQQATIAIDNLGSNRVFINNFTQNLAPQLTAEGFYTPWANFEDLWKGEYVTGVAPYVPTGVAETGADLGLGITEQTITAPETTTVDTAPVDTTTTPGGTGTGTGTGGGFGTGTPIAQPELPTYTPYTPQPTGVVGQTISTATSQGDTTGTVGTPLQTAGMSAVPETIQVRNNYTGTTMPNLTSQSQSGFGGQRTYQNAFGQTVTVTVDAQGNPLTYKPPGFDTLVGSQTPSTPQRQSPMDMFGQTGGQQTFGMGGGRGTGSTPYTGPMSGGPMSGNPTAAKPALSQLSTDQALIVGIDGWYVTAYTGAAKGGLMGMAEGGMTEGGPDVQLARRFLGFDGPASQLTNFLAANPGAAARMGKYQEAMAGMARNRVGAQEGVAGTTLEDFQKMQQNLITQTMQPIQAPVQQITPDAADFIGTTAGQTTAVSPMAEVGTVGTVEQAVMPTATGPGSMTPTTVAPEVQAQLAGVTGATGTVSDQAQATAEQQLTTSVSNIEAAQGTASLINAPNARQIQAGELISGVADAEKAAQFNEQIQAATATPSKQATVQGQLEGLMQQFEGGNTPAWAAGSMRTAMQTLAARGLGASSLAGQAVIQAAMEAALPVAQMDAQTQAQFEAQNLSNRQQRAMLAAQQRAQFLGQEFDQAFQSRVQNSARIGDIANMNFTAEQQIALEDSRAVNTMNLNNLSNRQAKVMAEAAALSQLDTQNLNNRQQAAVQNAQNFLQMDMQNLANEQQTEMFKAQQNIQSLFTDQAAENAASQFNATSENQTNQFFANLSTQTSQFNAAQQNAMDQFNVNSVNAMRQFNSEIQQQRDLFNAQNGLVVAQANAQWRQNLATLNTAALNESNMDFAKTINALTSKNLDEIWQRERDIMSFAFTSDQSAMDRALTIIMGDKELEFARTKLASIEDAADTELAMRFFFGTSPEGLLGGLNPFG